MDQSSIFADLIRETVDRRPVQFNAFVFFLQKLVGIYPPISRSLYCDGVPYWQYVHENIHTQTNMQQFFKYAICVYIYQLYSSCMYRDRFYLSGSPPFSYLTFLRYKYQLLTQQMSNIFYSEQLKNEMFGQFSKAQRLYRVFCRFVRKWRICRAPIAVDHDLGLNPLKEGQRGTMVIFQGGHKYIFKISELMNIIQTALTHDVQLFIEPLEPKNPYNNMPFDNATLYSIYFRIRWSDFIVPHLIHSYFMCGFCLDAFAFQNEANIREQCIRNYVYNSPPLTLFREVKTMMDEFRITKHLRIHKDFPKDVMCDIMRPYLHLYMIYQHSMCGGEKQEQSYDILKHKLDQFVDHNPHFGRKRMVLKDKRYTVDFNREHIRYVEQMVPYRVYVPNRYEDEDDEEDSVS